MGMVTVSAFDCYDGSSEKTGAKRRKVKKSLIPFMSNCVSVDGTDEVVDESQLDEDGFLKAPATA